MSLEPTQDAWDGMLWQQEQPIAWLLSRDIVNLTKPEPTAAIEETAGRDDEPADDPVPSEPMPVDDEDLNRDFDWSKSTPKYKLEKKAAREKNRILKPKTKSKTSPALKALFDLEREMRYKLTREEARFHADLVYHRRDDMEFWQLLERQRKRREDRVRRRVLRSDESSVSVSLYHPSYLLV